MSKFHVNSRGNAGKCEAQAGKCPFGGEAEHHDSMEAARTAFEASQDSFTTLQPQRKKYQQLGAGAVASPSDLEKMPPASSVMYDNEEHRKGVDGHWYHGYGGQSRIPVEMDGAVVRENASVSLHASVSTPEFNKFIDEVASLQESFPPQVREVQGLTDAIQELKATGDSRQYKFALSLLKDRIELEEDFINSEALDSMAHRRWLSAVAGAERALALASRRGFVRQP